MRIEKALVFITLILLAICSEAMAIDCSTAYAADKKQAIEKTTFLDLSKNQACIWTTPVRLHENSNLKLFVPWAGASAALIVTDSAVMRAVPTGSASTAKTISDVGLVTELGIGGAFYLTGLAKSNPHLRETGWLAGEAVANGMAVNLVSQRITRRNRPNSVERPGEWFQGGSAFPSDHAMASWAAATVIAHEYPGWFTKTVAYGTAATVSVTRVLSREHSPSDVFVGSSLGFLIGRYVYYSHHPDESSRFHFFNDNFNRFKLRPARAPFVPLDSPYYALLQRLISAGYIDSAIVGQRPWTRRECARLVAEARDAMSPEAPASMRDTLKELIAEFPSRYADDDNLPEYPVENVYARFTGISGTPLRDSFHFGQTLYNDFGRPYWTGGNGYLGASGATSMGPITFYARGEYQYSPGGGPIYSQAVQNNLMNIDLTPTALVPDPNSVSQFRLIEAYAYTSFKNIGFSFGKQAVWWGTSWDSAMLASPNSEPIYQFRVSQVSPIRLPWILKYLGPTNFDFFIGKFSGSQYPTQPYLHGQKLTFHPTENLELGFSRTVVFTGGPGHPLTLGQFWKSFTSFGDTKAAIPGTVADVGDRRGGFDFSYRIPGLRNWLTLYGDFFTDDDPSPLASIHRSAWNPGILLSHFPFIPNMDLRIEAPVTAPPFPDPNPAEGDPFQGQFFYRNNYYLSGYTNKGVIYGNWVGRQAKGIFAATRYWYSPTNVVEMSYRHSTLDPKFIRPGGGNYTDGRMDYRRELRSNVIVNGTLQVERWNVPMLGSSAMHNTTASVGITWSPFLRKELVPRN